MSTESERVEFKEALENAQIVGIFRYPIKSCGAESLIKATVAETGIEHDRELMLVDPTTGRFLSQRDKGCERLALVQPRFLTDDLLSISAPGMPDIVVPVVRKATEGRQIEASIHKKTGIRTIDQGSEAGEWFKTYLGRENCALVTMEEGYTRQTSSRWAVNALSHTKLPDGYPLLIAFMESLQDLQARSDQQIPMSRFRPNIVMAGSGLAYGEDRIIRVQLNNVILDGVKPCTRCPVINVDQDSGIRSSELAKEHRGGPLRVLSSYRMGHLRQGNKGPADGDRGPVFGMNATVTNIGEVQLGDKLQVLDIYTGDAGMNPDFGIME